MSATQVPFALPVKAHNYPRIYLEDANSKHLATFQEYEDRDAVIEIINNHAALVEALKPFAQIGDIVNDPDCTLWTRKVSAESVRRARAVLEQLRKAGEGK